MYSKEVFDYIANANHMTEEEFYSNISDEIFYAKKGKPFEVDGNPVGAIVRNIQDSGFDIGDLVYSKKLYTHVYSDSKMCVYSCSKENAILYKEPKEQLKEQPDIDRLRKHMDVVFELFSIDPNYLAKSLKELRSEMLLYKKVKTDLPDKKEFNKMWAALCMYSEIKGLSIDRLKACVSKYHVDFKQLDSYIKFKGGSKTKKL